MVTGGSQDSSTTRSRSWSRSRPEAALCPLVDGSVVVAEQGSLDADGADVLEAMAVTGGLLVERQLEPLAPPLGRPHLFVVEGAGEMVVLDPREVPDQPGDGVGLRFRAEGEVRDVEAVDHLFDAGGDALESVE